MALCPSGVVDIAAFGTAPVIRSRNIGFGIRRIVTSTNSAAISVNRFAFVAFLALIPEIKVQKIATGTVPLSVFTLFLTSISGTRTGTIFLLTFLTGLLLGIGKNALQ